MADGAAEAPSGAQPLSSTGELALPGRGTVTSSGRRCERVTPCPGFFPYTDLDPDRHDAAPVIHCTLASRHLRKLALISTHCQH